MGKPNLFHAVVAQVRRLYSGIAEADRRRGEQIEKDLSRLLVREEAREETGAFLREQRRRALLGLVCGSLVFAAVACASRGPEEPVLTRPGVPWETEVYTVEVSAGGKENAVGVTVAGREMTDEETAQLLDEAETVFLAQMLGKNPDADHVTEPLDFSGSAPGTPVRASFRPEEYRIVMADGSIDTDALRGNGPQKVVIFLELAAGEAVRSRQITVTVLEREETREDRLVRFFSGEEERTRREAVMPLPQTFEGEELSYPRRKSASVLLAAVFLLAGLPGVLWFLPLDRQRDRLRAREEELRADHPEILSSLALYARAGMSPANAWKSLAAAYERERGPAGRLTYGRAEVVHCAKLMEAGLSEEDALERFADRTGQAGYRRLALLLRRSLRQGERDLSEKLLAEAACAREEEKNRLRRLGEEAETKLTGPMVLYFAMVMAMVVLPAWLGMQI